MDQTAKEYLQVIEAEVIDFCKYLEEGGGVDYWDCHAKKCALEKRIAQFKEDVEGFLPLARRQVIDSRP